MGDLLRHVRVLAQNGFAPESDILDPVALRMIALPSDCDFNFHVNNARYLRLMDIGRLAVVTRSGLLGSMFRNQWGAVVGAAEIEFLRELPFLSRFTLESRVVGWDAKWFYFEQRFLRRGELAAVGRVQVVVRDGRKSVPTAEVIADLGPIRTSPALPSSFEHLASPSEHRQGRRRAIGVQITMDDLPGLDWAA